MSDWGWCRTCKAYDLLRTHRCPPAWLLWRPENGDTEEDARTVYGHSPEEVVEHWAQRDDSDSADHLIVGGSEATVHVRRVGDDQPELILVVVGESVPSYTAKQVHRTPQAQPEDSRTPEERTREPRDT